jgi:hypothetical protein
LSIVKAAGQDIPEGNPAPVEVFLPIGSSTNQTVTLRGRDFRGGIRVNVVVTPDNGPSATFIAGINMDPNGVGETNVNVVIPINTVSRIHAWTR